MINFKLIINCGPCEDFIARCISSVRQQSFDAWGAFVTVDPCGDNTYERAIVAADDDRRIRIQRNEERRYSMCNIVHAIQRSNAQPEDVIVCLDGDDWFASDDALSIIADVYQRFDCWVTYGSWLSNVTGPSGQRDGMYPAYPDGTTDFRGHRFLGTAVRTWKKWLWDHLKDSDLRNDIGEYVRVSEDQMIMIPLLELCGTARAKHIADPIMTYNKLVKYPIVQTLMDEGMRNGDLIGRRAPYPRLQNKAYVEMSASAT